MPSSRNLFFFSLATPPSSGIELTASPPSWFFSPASCLALLLVDVAVGLAWSQLYCAWRCWLALTWTLSAPGVSVSTVQKNQLLKLLLLLLIIF